MKNKIVIAVIVFVSIFVALIALLNANKPLADLDDFPNSQQISAAKLTSPSNYAQEESYLYSLSDEEFDELLRVLSTQEGNRSWFNNTSPAEYFLTLETDQQDFLFEISEDVLYVEESNNYYELTGEELYVFISRLNE